MFWLHYNRARKVMWGLFWVLLGVLLLLGNRGVLGYDFSLARDWPIILIAFGVMKIVDLLAWRGNGRCCRTVKVASDCCQGTKGPAQGPSRAEILQAVEEGKMSADEAASKLRGA